MTAAQKIEFEEQFEFNELKKKIELSLEEAAFYLGISRRTFYNTWKSRGLTGYRDHRALLFFKRADLDHYMKQARVAVREY
jgi:excisionase family DNA binding protein